jgi:hypothetical protein
MIKLYVDDAVRLVRKNMDEVDSGVELMLEQPETTALDEVIKRTIPEAVNAANRLTAAEKLQGLAVESTDYSNLTINSDGSVSFQIDESKTGPWLRLVSLKAADSGVVLTEVTPEASAEGRKQLNPYVRGRADDPALVGLQGTRLKFKYYSLKSETVQSHPANPFDVFTYMPECELERGRLYGQDAQGAHYLLSDGLLDAVIYQLTALVLTVFGLTEKAQIYLNNIK